MCRPPILGYSKIFVLFGAPPSDKTTNNNIKKFRFLMQNNVQLKNNSRLTLSILCPVVAQSTAVTQ